MVAKMQQLRIGFIGLGDIGAATALTPVGHSPLMTLLQLELSAGPSCPSTTATSEDNSDSFPGYC